MTPVTETPAETPVVRDHKWGFGAFLLVLGVYILTAVVIGTFARMYGLNKTHSIAVVLVGTVVPTALATLLALLVTKVRGNGPKVDLRWSYTREDLKAGFKFGLLGLVITTIAGTVWAKVVGEEAAKSSLGQLVDGQLMPVAVAITWFVYVWLIGPVCEEIIYRGLLWGALERLNMGRWVVFGLTTVIFAIAHLEPLRTSLLLVVGIPIGLARLYTGRLGASIVAHQINNFVPALAILLVTLGVIQP
ncbi:hypothetical protein SAMN05192558_102405 [Actinokineospora alba]|uniref:CAAX prenyl protease 2/Lysostaphin resistance protein A-like domain-containing protein n=1 Tax=Actinokineospora alba TaxID=504798 RepID=A0A1H0I4I1_9PSEU|nr:CPBP family intramembrane glutamic endopeptidase [Actinokineospora alba]TDP64606.1 hypothetical protein C8E96_0073 [Actinokineospora alba]SDI86081.1 hypothetical protein SAMN05421871_108104 [Actinokineospora alba]SDO26347.1 hypothetical protein SAMN05192558_102405 [Actinokineospora alba]